MLETERNAMLAEFSLDNGGGALSRLLSELAQERGQLKADLASQVEEVVSEFSLDNEDSALSRLVRQVEGAQQTITSEFSLDNEESSLSRLAAVVNRATEAIDKNLTLDDEKSALFRLKRELVDILERHEQQANSFQVEVKSALEAMKAKREESLRSTVHGVDFQMLVLEFVQREAQRGGDITKDTGDTPGEIKYCKKGDVVIELGPDCAAAGEKFVVEAKEDGSYDLSAARVEIETARKNRVAGIGLFVFSRKTAPANLETLSRLGDDIFVVWDADDVNSDVTLRAALLLAKALCVRQAKARETTTADFQSIDASILEIEQQAKRLGNIRTWTETVQSNSGKVLDEVRKMSEALDRQIQVLREGIEDLKGLPLGLA
jgi:gas vesicle protein